MRRISVAFALVFLFSACDKTEECATLVGPAGGVVEGPDGIILTVPAGALAANTCIRITAASGSATGFVAVGPAYSFAPHGLQFDAPVSLTMPYQPTLVPGSELSVRLFMGDTAGGVWTEVGGTVDTGAHTVSAAVDHFSYGALGVPLGPCVPDCTGRVCGGDGCGGVCGPGCFGATPDCNETTGQCECIPDCAGRECGDDGCGGTCDPGCGTMPCNPVTGLCPVCGDGTCDLGENPGNCATDCPPTSEVDLLFVIDNSGSMAGEQANLRANFPALMTQLASAAGGLPNVHIGVTTTDLGTGMFQITYCEEVGGDAGNLVMGNCANPTGAPYIVDVEAEGCSITKDVNGQCSAHSCSQTNCSHEGATTFVEDSLTGCPRCRNYAGESLEDVFSCIANLGTMGCGFEQPLEALYKALDPATTANSGFLRADSVLAVILVTDEDDCSASNPQLYDNTQTDINSTLGPLTSYRCFEFGVTCDINSRTHQGMRHNCVPRDDAAALLHPMSRYVGQLQGLRDPGRIVLAAIAGPVTPSPGGGYDMVVGLDDMSNPDLQYSCTTATDGAVPGIRVYSLVEAFNTTTDLADWAYSSICSSDYTTPLQGVGQQIGTSFQ